MNIEQKYNEKPSEVKPMGGMFGKTTMDICKKCRISHCISYVQGSVIWRCPTCSQMNKVPTSAIWDVFPAVSQIPPSRSLELEDHYKDSKLYDKRRKEANEKLKHYEDWYAEYIKELKTNDFQSEMPEN